MTEPGVTILDPSAGSRFILDTHSKIARAVTVYAPSAAGIAKGGDRVVTGEEAEKLKAEIDAARAAQGVTVTVAPSEGGYATTVKKLATIESLGGTGGMIALSGMASKYESQTEDLGVQNIEGVDAEGTRTITTIPAGAIGNERPIEIVYEKWYSKELQIIVKSVHNDPRYGEQTYRLTNIIRSEPDPSLFEVPNGYTFKY